MSQRFFILDGLRGVAAIVVVCFHLGFFKWIPAPSFGYLAVDLFFALSGFVIAHAYDSRFASRSMTFRDFMLRRSVRLFPLYLAGLLIGIALEMRTQFLFPTVSWMQFCITAMLNLFLLPTPFLSDHPAGLFPSDPPAWSLVLELWVANLIYGAAWRFLNTKTLLVIIFVSAAALVGSSLYFGSLNLGVRWTEIFVGISRVSFSFFVGVLVSRLRLKGMKNGLSPIPIFVGLALILCMPLTGALARFYELFCIFFIFPGLIAIGAQSSSKSHPQLSAWLGDVSYALYLIHYPMLLKIDTVSKVRGIEQGPATSFAFVTLMIGLSTVLDVFYDRPLRNFLTRHLTPSSAKVEK
jgi:peptidoglycan/LPS O-acetylase OafA/YrhL